MGTVALADRVCGRQRVLMDRRTVTNANVYSFIGFRFPRDVILLAVRWYLRYGLSYRDVEELLTEWGVEVDRVTIFRWVQRFTPELIGAARPCRHTVGDRWFVDETYVKVAGVWRYVYRAVDQYGQVIDVYVSKRRNDATAREVLHYRAVQSRSAAGGHHRPGGSATACSGGTGARSCASHWPILQ